MPQPRKELSPPARAHEAMLLAVMLRTSRLTWVFGQPGADKSALLKTGVLPLLQRRRIDRGATALTAALKFAAPERRRPPAARQAQQRIEAAIYFDSWGDTPLTLLKRRIFEMVPSAPQQSSIVGTRLADLLQRLNQQCGVHVIFLLDHFESYLAMAPDAGEAAQFANELVEVVLHQDLPASFLIAMDEAARSQLERFRQRMPEFDQNFLRMSALTELQDCAARYAAAATLDSAASIEALPTPPAAAAVQRARRRPTLSAPIRVDDIYALIEATLAKTTISGPVELGQMAAKSLAEPAPALVSGNHAIGAPRAIDTIISELEDDIGEDSFFSLARDGQRQPGGSKKPRGRGLATALTWLKKRQ